MQWLRLGSAEEEERAHDGAVSVEGTDSWQKEKEGAERSDSAGLIINYRSQEKSRKEEGLKASSTNIITHTHMHVLVKLSY